MSSTLAPFVLSRAEGLATSLTNWKLSLLRTATKPGKPRQAFPARWSGPLSA